MNGLDVVLDEYVEMREKYSIEHDMEHGPEILARAGACYADYAANRVDNMEQDAPHPFWPEGWEWNPGESDIETLAKAAALLISALDVIYKEM